MNAQLVAVSQNIAFLGDSRAKPFDGRVVAIDGMSENPVVTVSRWISFLRASWLYDGTRVAPRIARALWEMRFLEAEERGHPAFGTVRLHTVVDGERDFALLPRCSNRHLVVACGQVDALDLERDFYGVYWLDLDMPADYVPAVEPYRAPTQLGEAVVYERFRRTFEPLFAMLDLLADSGVGRLHLMGLARPRPNGYPTADLRQRLTLLANRVYRDECAKRGIDYIDAWALYATAGGTRDERYFREDHYAAEAVPLMVARVLGA